jgi:hypothetical protein
MGAISILGFIVWAQLGLFMSDHKVIKLHYMLEGSHLTGPVIPMFKTTNRIGNNQQVTIFQDLFLAANLWQFSYLKRFYSINNYNMGSSETTRETTNFEDWFIAPLGPHTGPHPL